MEGGGIREVCPVTVGLLCTGRLSRLFLSMCNRGFQDLLSVRPSSLFMLNGCIYISMASLGSTGSPVNVVKSTLDRVVGSSINALKNTKDT